MTDTLDPTAAELARIAELPLAQRAAAFVQLHAQLGTELEQADRADA